jgi:hypothetical protein
MAVNNFKNGLPTFDAKPIPGGSVNNAVILQQRQSAIHQNNLGKTGGYHKKKWKKGGATATANVPPLPSYTPDKGGSASNIAGLNQLANLNTVNGAYDGTVNGGTQNEVNHIHRGQVNMLSGKGGGRRGGGGRKGRSNKRGTRRRRRRRRTLKRGRK